MLKNKRYIVGHLVRVETDDPEFEAYDEAHTMAKMMAVALAGDARLNEPVGIWQQNGHECELAAIVWRGETTRVNVAKQPA